MGLLWLLNAEGWRLEKRRGSSEGRRVVVVAHHEVKKGLIVRGSTRGQKPDKNEEKEFSRSTEPKKDKQGRSSRNCDSSTLYLLPAEMNRGGTSGGRARQQMASRSYIGVTERDRNQ